jgi:sugar phosphate isomerase/epimerase
MNPLRYAYNTNGLAHHRLDDALALLADLGYAGCALTLDHVHLDPFAPDAFAQARALGRRARALGLGLVVETGARFLLDPRRKHEPTLVSATPEGRERRLSFLRLAIDLAIELGAPVVSLWSGVRGADVSETEAWSWLAAGLGLTLEHAARRGIVLGFEPEPGMLVAGLDDWARLRRELRSPELGLTLDLGHVLLTEPDPPEHAVRRFGAELVNVHAEDMRRGVHEHLMFGEGEMDYRPILAALAEVGYGGLVAVELSRDSHRAPEVARRALDLLRAAAGQPA